MHIPRIYTPDTLSENTHIELNPQIAHHIGTVMRMKVGRNLILFNGMGGEFSATITHVTRKQVVVELGQFSDVNRESPLAIELGACLIKNDRMDWLLQKATELGVSAITPLFSEYTDVKLPADRMEKKYTHWQQVIINACEQSGRTCIPKLVLPKKLSDWVDEVQADKKVVLHPYVNGSIQTKIESPSSLALLVGPEGGLSEAEVANAVESQFLGVALGPRILRAETAPLAVLAILQSQFGDCS